MPPGSRFDEGDVRTVCVSPIARRSTTFPGLYARVASCIEEQRPPEPFWAALLEPVFGRRLVLASLLVLATLGTVLMSRETEYAAGPSPEMILAVERDATPLQSTPLMDRDQMLFTLASHKQ